MNHTDINKLIAELKGIKIRIADNVVCYEPECVIGWHELDYITDPKLILELVIELGLAGWLYSATSDKEHMWLRHVDECVINKDFGLCTAMAWIEEYAE